MVMERQPNRVGMYRAFRRLPCLSAQRLCLSLRQTRTKMTTCERSRVPPQRRASNLANSSSSIRKFATANRHSKALASWFGKSSMMLPKVAPGILSATHAGVAEFQCKPSAKPSDSPAPHFSMTPANFATTRSKNWLPLQDSNAADEHPGRKLPAG